jgi:lipopolysaccharide assembly outer membrane protein LptD (OstA)
LLISSLLIAYVNLSFEAKAKSLPLKGFYSEIIPDSNIVSVDSLAPSENSKKEKKKPLDSEVSYKAKDSILFDLETKILYLYGDAEVLYENIEMKAAYIELNMEKKTVYAIGMADSLGNIVGSPKFKEGNQEFDAKSMKYNFDTKKGLIKDVITQEGDGYIHGQDIKKLQNDVMYIKSGKYTTCDLEHPHFYLNASKIKIIPKDKIVTGPSYMVIEDIPTPLVLPFGFFPNTESRSSGVLIPTYGESPGLGFFLLNGGFYWGASDYFDMALTGDIYSRGSWGAGVASNYKKKYKYNGQLSGKFSNIKLGEKEFPDFQNNRDFMLRWTHKQDPKAKPNSNFSADLTAGSSNFNRFNSMGSSAFLTNTLQSNIAYTHAWSGTPFNVSFNGGHTQNTISKEVNITLPQAVFNMNRVFPFKRKEATGAQKWYEKIGVSYVANVRNQLSTYDSLLLDANNLNRMRNGVQHNIPVSTSMKVLKHFTLTPTFTYTDRWYFQTIEKQWDNELQSLNTDTLRGFRRIGEYNVNANVTTKVYGMYQFKKSKTAIRHVITPSIGLAYRPDFGTQEFGYYNPNGAFGSYSPFEIGIFGFPAPGEQGLITFNIINNLEAKFKSEKDTTDGFRKIKIFETFNFNTSYNTLAQEFKWAPINIVGRTKLLENIDLNFGATVDPYALDSIEGLQVRVDDLLLQREGKVGRFTMGRLAINFTLKPDMFAKKSESETKKTPPNKTTYVNKGMQNDLDYIYNNPFHYVDFTLPWSLSVFFNVNYMNRENMEANVTQALTFNGDLQLTQKWRIGFNSGYDFQNKGISYTSLNVYRDLHCWEMRFSWIPFGFNQSYTLDINVKASALQDLKLTRRRSWFDVR